MFLKKSALALALALTALSVPAPAAGRAPAVAVAPLSSIETQDLSFMREEEKLARDVYLALHEQWGLVPFASISAGEQKHMDAVLALLRKYGLPDPAATLFIGEFADAELQAWYGESLDNKPYIAVDDKGSVFVVDPEGYRILQFTDEGEAVRVWGDYGAGLDTFSLPASVAVDQDGNVWVVDTGNNRLMHFVLPQVE